MPPTTRPESSSVVATAASASGKLAPHRIAGGRIAHRQRAISSWKMNHGLDVSRGLMGQYGSESAVIYAVQAKAIVSKAWQQPSASLGRTVRANHAPPKLPIPMPIRKTARIIENT